MNDRDITALQITSWDRCPNWDSFVAEHPAGTIFHESAMIRAFQATKGVQPWAAAVVNDRGEILALLSAVHVATLRGLLSRLASRSIWYAEPIGRTDALGAAGLTMLVKAHDHAWQHRCLFAEVRPVGPPGLEQHILQEQGYLRECYLNYILPLASPTDELWRKLDKKCRSDIQRSFDRGVEIHEDPSTKGLETLYQHLQQSYARSAVPLVDRSLFDAVRDHMPSDSWRVIVATYQGEPVASACFLIDRTTVHYWYAGVNRIKGIAANACILWHMIQWSVEHGKQRFDFGGAGRPGEDYGPGKFKSRFGGDLVQYGRYRKVYTPTRMWLAEHGYAVLRKLLAPAADRSGRGG